RIKPRATFYYDILSPYAYILLKTRAPLEQKLHLRPVPIFLPGLFKAHGVVGPMAIPSKRAFIYASVVHTTKKLGIPFKFSPRHPFTAVSALRLLTQIDADLNQVEMAFDFVFGQGNDPDDNDIKAKLIANTVEAARRGVFGVPTIEVNDRLFFGSDSMEWLLEYVDNPDMFSDPEYAAAWTTENPLSRI
ncbi:DSBA oxidoreductase, partial [Achlya hypogyna]